MWILPLPDHQDSIEDLKTSLTFKSGKEKFTIESDVLNSIKRCYEKYEEVQGKASQDLLDLSKLDEEVLSAIHDAYSEVQENKRLSYLRDRLLLAAGRCPCCGIGAADELDHHLPRSVYKILAVYSSNLVPMCHKCNNKKRTVAGLTSRDSFIHIYYDRVPENDRFLFAKTEIIDGRLLVEFEVQNIPSLSPELYEMLMFQTKRVEFNKRVIKEVNIFLGAFMVSLDMIYNKSHSADQISSL
ncbi:HNH endonuclease [Aeromonas popoffii]|uniref:HNH endonuclease n=1 Tax=Aeromonas popoffii TaxID=70856 RepID=A0ABS5GTE5_9GAMM|nr:HNH endonuclease signature motif containing protein [Aeromonas popoffii]MBR7630298.1 HNH endonuclease [Aeromonas popoffii]